MDRRLIRTAVFGSPDSDDPALCPETAEGLDAFWREHEGVTIWCGTMFEGGCGRQLMTRRCTDKICHFAHYASGDSDHQCGRKMRGKDSADHLFAKAHLASWLHAQGISAEFDYPEPRGSAVVVRLEDGRSLLAHLDRNRPVAWENDAWEIILGPGVPIAPWVLAERGYVHRIGFEDRPGGGRTMKFGTQLPVVGTNWGSLNDVALTPQSLVTTTKPVAVPAPTAVMQPAGEPAERTIVTIAPSTVPTGAAGRQAGPVMKALLNLDSAKREHPRRTWSALEAIRELLQTDHIPADDVARLRLALAGGERWIEERAGRRRALVERLRERPTESLLREAAELIGDPGASAQEREAVAHARRALEQKRAAREREQANRREAEKRERAERLEAQTRELAERLEAQRCELVEAQERYAHERRVEKVQQFAPAVRGALKKAAREGRVTTWSEIAQKTGLHRLTGLDHHDKVELLVLVESDTASEDPLWSALLATPGDALRLHRDVSERLSRPLPDDDADLIKQLTAECTQLHRAW